MGVNQLTKLETLFHALLEVPAGAEREAAAVRLSEGDADLARQALHLVASDEKAEAVNRMAREANLAPRLYGNYRTTRLLGTGGMGTVYLAERADGQFEQTAAVKVIAPYAAGEAFRERFLAERQILATLSHPNIAKLLDGGVTPDGTPYLVLEYVDGQPLDHYCDGCKMGIRERLELFGRLCDPIAYAHRNLVVHRDLKPSNILVTADGRPILLDFGTAKLLTGTDGANHTATVGPMLTLRYSSPEQRARAPITTSTDIFSLGVILYELLAGVWPFGDANSPEQVLQRFAHETPMTAPASAVTDDAAAARGSNAKTLKSSLAGDLTSILGKALAPVPEERYESVQALSADVGNWLGGLPVSAKAPKFSYYAGKFLRRHWVPVAAAVVFVVGLVGATLFALYEARVAKAEAVKSGTVTRFLGDLLEAQNPVLAGANRSMNIAEAIDRARQNLDQFGNQPSVQAELHLRLGSAYRNLLELDKAETELRKAVESGRRAEDSEKVAVGEAGLATVLVQLGKNQPEADALCADALKRSRAIRSPDALSMYLVLGDSAIVRWLGHGHSPEVVALATEAIATAKKDPSVPSWRPATGEVGLAQYFLQEGRNADAEALLKDALELEGRARRPGIGVGIILSLLGTIRSQAGDFGTAEEYQHKYLEEMVRILGAENERTSDARALWAASLARLGRGKEAISECREALEVKRRTPSAAPSTISSFLSICAYALNVADQPVEAEADAREAVRLTNPRAGGWGLIAAQANAELGIALLKQRRYKEAVLELEKGERVLLASPAFGPKHHMTVRTKEALAAARAASH